MTDLPQITEAINAADSELHAIRVEVDAFEHFRQRLRPLAIVSPSTAPSEQSATTLVVDLYRETVVGAGDFDDAYDETLEEHMANEFAPGLVERLRGTNHLTGDLKRKLLAATEGAIESRRRLIGILETERASLEEAHATLAAINRRLDRTQPCTLRGSSLEKVVDAWETLDGLADDCEAIAERRQRFRTERCTPGFEIVEPLELDVYLYGDLDTIHPVLRSVTETLAEIESRKRFEDGQRLHA